MTNSNIKIEIIDIEDSDSEQVIQPKVEETQQSKSVTQVSNLPETDNTQIEQRHMQPSTSQHINGNHYKEDVNYLLDRCKYYHNKLLTYEPIMHGFQVDRWLEHLRTIEATSSYLENPLRPKTEWEAERANYPVHGLPNNQHSFKKETNARNSTYQRKKTTPRRAVKRVRKSPKKVRKPPKKAPQRAPQNNPPAESSSSTRQTDAFLRAKQAAKAMRDRMAKAKTYYQNSVNSGRRPPPGSSNQSTSNVKKDSSPQVRVKTEKQQFINVKTEKSSSVRFKTEK